MEVAPEVLELLAFALGWSVLVFRASVLEQVV